MGVRPSGDILKTDARHPFEPGQVVSERYRIEGLLGSGGMGAVYVAIDQVNNNERVAIKAPWRDSAASDLARFDREGRIAARLSHPNIVATLDVGSHEEHPFLVFEYLRGEDLAQRLRSRSRPLLDDLLRWMMAAVRGIAVAHSLDIIHRDIKPSNIFLLAEEAGGDARVRVLDFGISKVLDPEAGDSITRTQEVIGTSSYMAPEQIYAPKQVDARADVWSLGVCLFEGLTGERPFRRATSLEVMAAVLREPAPRVRDRCTIPQALDDIVACCLEGEPSRRFRDAGALLEALEAYQRGERLILPKDVFGSSTFAGGKAAASLQPEDITTKKDVLEIETEASNPPHAPSSASIALSNTPFSLAQTRSEQKRRTSYRLPTLLALSVAALGGAGLLLGVSGIFVAPAPTESLPTALGSGVATIEIRLPDLPAAESQNAGPSAQTLASVTASHRRRLPPRLVATLPLVPTSRH
jgi:eukaryotic-like serine/threonine-protein kinase